MSMDPLAPAQPAAEPTKRQLAEENAALKARLAELDAQVASLTADLDAARASAQASASRPVGEESPVLLVAMRHDGHHYPAGALVPFDVAKPPKGCEGLVEGVHYERARVVRVPA